MERWEIIPGFKYYISDYGRVKNFNNEIIKQIKGKPRWEKDGLLPTKERIKAGTYMYVRLYKNNSHHRKSVHRLVGKAFVPNPLFKSTINHIDNIRHNNYYKNLQWSTMQEQYNHAYKLGFSRAGENNPSAILTWEKVNLIRAEYKNTSLTQHELGIKYGVSQNRIWAIVNNKQWI